MSLSSGLSPGTGTRASLAKCHGAPGGNLDSRSASRGCTRSGSGVAGSVLASARSIPQAAIPSPGGGAGQPSPLLTRRQRGLDSQRSGTKALRGTVHAPGQQDLRARRLSKVASKVLMLQVLSQATETNPKRPPSGWFTSLLQCKEIQEVKFTRFLLQRLVLSTPQMHVECSLGSIAALRAKEGG
eukprot:2559832-Amphidinium_carterae.1